MPQTATQTSKKQAPMARRPPSEKPHRDLASIQEEIADLASDLLMNGGSQRDLSLFMTALLRHQYRKHSFAKNDTEADINARINPWLDRQVQKVIKLWPEPVEKPVAADGRKLATVKEIAKVNVRHELRDRFESFLTNDDGLEPLWVLSEILSYCNDCAYDITKAFAVVMDSDNTYIPVPWSQADKIRAFVTLIAEKDSE